MEKYCPKCNTVMKEATLISYSNAEVMLKKHKEKMWDIDESSLEVYVCPQCGYIELYAEEPERFK